MRGFVPGFGCGAVAAAVLGTGLALAQGSYPITNAWRVGVAEINRPLGIACVNAQGQPDPGRRARVAWPQGVENNPEVYVMCYLTPR